MASLIPFFRAGLVAALGLAAPPALALEWFTETGDAAITTSAFEGGRSIALRCAAGELTLSVGLRKADLAEPLSAADPVFVVTTVDPSADGAPSFTARATPEAAGSSTLFRLTAKDSAARLPALLGGKEMAFALTAEPGGERLNEFRFVTPSAAEALAEVLAACNATASAAADTPAPAPAPAPSAAVIGPDAGDVAIDRWHLSGKNGRTALYLIRSSGTSITFACAANQLSVDFGIADSELKPAIRAQGVTTLMLRNGRLTQRADVAPVRLGDSHFFHGGDSMARPVIEALVADRDTLDIGILAKGMFSHREQQGVYGDLAAVLAACTDTPAAAPAAGQNAAPAAPAPPAPPKSFAVGPGELADGRWHFVEDDKRAALYNQQASLQSLTLECSTGQLSIVVGMPAPLLDPSLTVDRRANIVLVDGADFQSVAASRVTDNGVAFYRLRGPNATEYLRTLASREAPSVALAPFTSVSGTRPDQLRHPFAIDPQRIEGGLQRVLSACNLTPAVAAAPAVEEPPAVEEAPVPELPAAPLPQAGVWRSEDIAGVRYARVTFDNGAVGVDLTCADGHAFWFTIFRERLDPAAASGPVRLIVRQGGTTNSVMGMRTNESQQPGFFLAAGTDAQFLIDALMGATGTVTFALEPEDSERLVNLFEVTTQGLRPALEATGCKVATPPEDELVEGEWRFFRTSDGMAVAGVRKGDATLLLQCFGPEIGIATSYSFPIGDLHERMASRDVADYVQVVDGRDEHLYFDDHELQRVGGNVSLNGIMNIDAEWLQRLRRANRSIDLGLSLDAYNRGRIYNRTSFSARGSTAALNEILDACRP
ncbi:MAG: hypothetical protein EOP22_17945 [Hyphomicrobiales bacterium]|nr:MAG: hypothetical protein EOP22_17945 [Hyphomicrobiales bacterium]